MDAYKVVVTKRDTRTYTDQPIPDEVLQRILQAGRMAGSSKNTQPVRLVVIRDREWLKQIAECGKFSQPLLGAQAGIAVCCAPDGSEQSRYLCRQPSQPTIGSERLLPLIRSGSCPSRATGCLSK